MKRLMTTLIACGMAAELAAGTAARMPSTTASPAAFQASGHKPARPDRLLESLMVGGTCPFKA